MAFYKVKFDGKEYVNQHLCRAANKLGDAGIFRAVAKKDLTQKQLFDNILFSVEPAHAENYMVLENQIEVQDIDDALAHLVIVKPDNEGVSPIVVAKAEVFTYKKHRFIKLSDITDAKKYRNQVHMAVVQVCGCIYVALNAVIDTEKAPIVVTIKE